MKRCSKICCLLVETLLVAGLLVSAASAATIIEGPDTQGPFSGFSTGTFTLPQFDTLGDQLLALGVAIAVHAIIIIHVRRRMSYLSR